MSTRTLLLTHVDLDGASALVVASLFSLNIDKVEFMDYKTLYVGEEETLNFSIDEKWDRILVVDVSCNKELYEHVKSHSGMFGIFDHHDKTSEISELENVYYSVDKSGSELFFDVVSTNHRYPAMWKEYIRAVSVYDLWDLDSPLRELSEDLNRLFYQSLNYGYDDNDIRKYSSFVNSQVSKMLGKGNSFFFTDGERNAIERAKEKEHREYKSALSKMKIRTDERGVQYGLYHGSSKISYVCNEILNNHPELSYVVSISTYSGTAKKKTNGKLSVRSVKDFDVTTLQGINGHKNAGGGQFELSFVKEMWYTPTQHLGYRE